MTGWKLIPRFIRSHALYKCKKASEAKRTAQNYTDWLDDYATQVAAAWVLSCVFVRFLEGHALHETPLFAGPFGQADNENHGNHKSPASHKSHSPEATDSRLQRNEAKRPEQIVFGTDVACDFR